MSVWQEDLLNLLVSPYQNSSDVFSKIKIAVSELGFEFISFGLQMPYPVTKPKIVLLDNYPEAWAQHYAQQNYMANDPTVLHGRISTEPMVWSDEAFACNAPLWADVQDFGICAGWAQSCLKIDGASSLVSLSRSGELLTPRELLSKEVQMRWLVQVAHAALTKIMMSEQSEMAVRLTSRERAVLQWTADGKSAQDIADIFNLSKSAVDFHFKNLMVKLECSNKTAAVVRAALLGLLT